MELHTDTNIDHLVFMALTTTNHILIHLNICLLTFRLDRKSSNYKDTIYIANKQKGALKLLCLHSINSRFRVKTWPGYKGKKCQTPPKLRQPNAQYLFITHIYCVPYTGWGGTD